MTFYAEDSDVLCGGEWVRHGLVWRWEPAADVEPIFEEADEPAWRPHDLVACPVCLARMDEPCKTRGTHESRLVPRVCSCGADVRPQEPMCGHCRAEMAREEAA